MQPHKYQKLILFGLALCTTVFLALRIFLAFSYAAETGGVSVNIMFSIRNMIENGTLYTLPEEPPFAITQYMPLHYYCVAGLAKLLGMSHDVHQLIVVNRVFCLLLSLFYCALTAWLIRKTFPQSGRFLAYAMGMISFICIPNINYSRTDNLYLVFNTIAIAAFLFYLRKKEKDESYNGHELILAGMACALGMMTKQTSFITTLLLGGFLLLWQRDWRNTMKFSLVCILTFVPAFLLFLPADLWTFKLNIVDGLKNGIKMSWFITVIVNYYYMRFGMYIAFGFYLAGWMIPKHKSLTGSFLSVAILYYFVMGTFLSLKAGSGPNYYLEFTTLSMLGLAYTVQHRPGMHLPYLPFFLCWLPFFIYPYLNDKGWSHITQQKLHKAEYRNCLEVSSYLKKQLGPNSYVLTNFHKENCLNLMLCEKALFPMRDIAVTYTRPLGVFTFKRFGELMEKGQVRYYVDYTAEPLRKDFMDIPLDHFVKDTIIGSYQIYQYSSELPDSNAVTISRNKNLVEN